MDLVEAKARGFEPGARHPWERARLAIVGSLIDRHATLDLGETVLDIGCGDTFIVEQLGRAHPRARFYAVDSAFTTDIIETYRARLSANNVSLYASLDEVPLGRPASLVLLMDVIEHVADDRGLLEDLMARPLFGRDTHVLITVPAYRWLFSSHDRLLGHYRRYSMRTLRTLLDAVGLRPVECGYFFSSLLPLRMLQVIRERVSRGAGKVSTDLSTWNGGEGMGRALAALLTCDGWLAIALARSGLRVPGLSAFAICRKSA